jgi:hypothetical protein
MFLGQPILVVILSFEHIFYIMRAQMVDDGFVQRQIAVRTEVLAS